MSVLFIAFFNTLDFAYGNEERSALYQNRIQFFYPYRLEFGNGSLKSFASTRACSRHFEIASRDNRYSAFPPPGSYAEFAHFHPGGAAAR